MDPFRTTRAVGHLLDLSPLLSVDDLAAPLREVLAISGFTASLQSLLAWGDVTTDTSAIIAFPAKSADEFATAMIKISIQRIILAVATDASDPTTKTKIKQWVQVRCHWSTSPSGRSKIVQVQVLRPWPSGLKVESYHCARVGWSRLRSNQPSRHIKTSGS